MTSAEDVGFDNDMRVRAAWLYYMEGLTQDAIAQVLGITRARVLRILASCRQDGTVQVRVTSQLSHCVEIERRLEQRFGLDRAIVIPRPQDDGKINALVGEATGTYLRSLLTDGMSVGLGWGETLSMSLSQLRKQQFKKMTVVSLLGGLTRVNAFNPSEFAWRFADRLGADCFIMAVPVYAPDERTRDALMTHLGIEEVFRRAQRLDLAIVSVGNMSPNSTLRKFALLSRDEVASLERAGAVGDVLCRFIDAEGRVIDHSVNTRVIAADPAKLRSARKVVLASGGWAKAPVILAALRLLKPAILVTDFQVAETLMS